ncbi:conserved unknown protein [Ectocarpus siliculosus]|uniref:DUF2306 domain-containing protein n=1 Tax=Ectocarpus siliculosus TaxID=2880 RepID=D7FX31_ECTSI|nr:conserved unknown protein [Ectocarpus siliculosus]|eukprot:CBJ26364.1 conserved unknown protein [Ectocarpus siliculosus]
MPWLSKAIWSLFLLLSCIMVFHNVVLRSWGIGSFASITTQVVRQGEQGFFRSTPLYDAEGKPSFLAYARTPAGRFMHILPAGLWSVIAPLQLNPSFRAKHRTAHRRLGRLFIFMSVSMALGVVPIVLSGASLIRRSVAVDGGLFTLAAYFLATGVLAATHARSKRFADHRIWILRHVAMGYAAHVQRLLAALSWWAIPLVAPAKYTELSPEGALLRGDVFGGYFLVSIVLCVGLMEMWLRHTTTASGTLREERDQDKPATKTA